MTMQKDEILSSVCLTAGHYPGDGTHVWQDASDSRTSGCLESDSCPECP